MSHIFIFLHFISFITGIGFITVVYFMFSNRFTPSIKAKDEESHGINERMPIDNYKQYISFYIQLIKDFQSK